MRLRQMFTEHTSTPTHATSLSHVTVTTVSYGFDTSRHVHVALTEMNGITWCVAFFM